MAPRNRDKRNAHLAGTNIKAVTRDGQTYYYWRAPVDTTLPDQTPLPKGTMLPLEHGDERTSIEAAHALNRALLPSGGVVERAIAQAPRPATRNPPLVEVLDLFEAEWLLEQNYSLSSLKQRQIKLNQYRREWPHTKVADIDTFVMAGFLRQFGAESARQHRVLLEQVFRFAASRGYSTQNPMAMIERRRQAPRARSRHTWDGYQAIYDASPRWLQVAQDAALYSLQRRGDLVAINIEDHIDLKRRTIRILQQKSRNYDRPVHIEIKMGDELHNAVLRSVWSGINCPYLIHHRPVRLTQQTREKKPHPFAVLPEYLTRAYSEVRDSVGVYNHLPKIQRPGFHSIRAMGIWLYTKAGYSDEYIMALAGHATEAMKARYYEGHERPAPVNVNADLALSDVDLSDVNWETDLSPSLMKLADSGE